MATQSPITVDQQTASLLGKIALSGLWAGYAPFSEQIFRSLTQLRPENVGPWLGQAMAFAHKGEYANGLVFLEENVLPRFPQDPHVLGWHGFLLCMEKRGTRGRAVLEKLLQGTDVPEDVRKMASEALSTLK